MIIATLITKDEKTKNIIDINIKYDLILKTKVFLAKFCESKNKSIVFPSSLIKFSNSKLN